MDVLDVWMLVLYGVLVVLVVLMHSSYMARANANSRDLWAYFVALKSTDERTRRLERIVLYDKKEDEIRPTRPNGKETLDKPSSPTIVDSPDGRGVE